MTPFMYSNLADNQSAFAQGIHPHWALTYEFSYDFSSSLGGTGATFVVPFILILFTKSRQLKAVGFASFIPIWFQVNEPALFGVPLILNPIAFLPFTIIPVINIEIYKFFINVIGMNGAIADVPWSIPAIIGLELGTGIQGWQPALLWILLVVIDFVLWIPFLLIFDCVICNEENIKSTNERLTKPLHYNYWAIFYSWMMSKFGFSQRYREKKLLFYTAIKTDIKKNKSQTKETKNSKDVPINSVDKASKLKEVQVNAIKKEYQVLIICYGSGTSAMFAESARKGAIQQNIDNITISAVSYGHHKELMKKIDLVVLAPQLSVYMDEIKRDATVYNVKIVETKGKEYISCTTLNDRAINFILEKLFI